MCDPIMFLLDWAALDLRTVLVTKKVFLCSMVLRHEATLFVVAFCLLLVLLL